MDERIFRRPTWLVTALVVASAASIIAFTWLYLRQGVTARTAAFGVVCAVLCVGVLDARVVRVIVRDDVRCCADNRRSWMRASQ